MRQQTRFSTMNPSPRSRSSTTERHRATKGTIGRPSSRGSDQGIAARLVRAVPVLAPAQGDAGSDQEGQKVRFSASSPGRPSTAPQQGSRGGARMRHSESAPALQKRVSSPPMHSRKTQSMRTEDARRIRTTRATTRSSSRSSRDSSPNLAAQATGSPVSRSSLETPGQDGGDTKSTKRLAKKKFHATFSEEVLDGDESSELSKQEFDKQGTPSQAKRSSNIQLVGFQVLGADDLDENDEELTESQNAARRPFGRGDSGHLSNVVETTRSAKMASYKLTSQKMKNAKEIATAKEKKAVASSATRKSHRLSNKDKVRKSMMASVVESVKARKSMKMMGMIRDDADEDDEENQVEYATSRKSISRHRMVARKWKLKSQNSMQDDDKHTGKVRMLGQIWLFSRCSPKFLGQLAQSLTKISFEAFEELASSGDNASDVDFCVIEEGSVIRLLEDGTDLEQPLLPGRHFGAWSLVGFDSDLQLPLSYAAGSEGAVVGFLSRFALDELLTNFPEDDTAIAQAVATLQATGEFLRRSQLFASLPPALTFNIIEHVRPVRCARGEALVLRDQIPDALYVIDIGMAAAEVELKGTEQPSSPTAGNTGSSKWSKLRRLKDPKDQKSNKAVVLAKLAAGAIIGEHAIINAKIPSSLTIRAQTQCVALRLSYEDLASESLCFPDEVERMKDLANQMEESHTAFASHLHLVDIPFFSKLGDRFIDVLQQHCERRVVIPGSIVTRGVNEGLFVIQAGSVSHQLCGIHMPDLKEGDYFGELALLGSTVRTSALLRAETTAGYIVFQRALLEEILVHFPQFPIEWQKSLGDEYERLALTENDVTDVLSKLSLFRECNPTTLPIFCSGLSLHLAMPGKVIFTGPGMAKEGSLSDKGQDDNKGGMIVVLRGCAQTAGQQLVHAGTAFGEGSLFGIPQPKTDPITAVSPCVVATLKRSVFDVLMDKMPAHQTSFETALLEMFDKTSVKAGASIYKWPLFTGSPSRFLYILDLHLVRRIYLDKSVILDMNDTELSVDNEYQPSGVNVQSSTLFFAYGTAHVFHTTENEGMWLDKELQAGDIFGELTLLGVPFPAGLQVFAHGVCDIQMLSNRAFRLACAEFPAEKARYKHSLAQHFLSHDEGFKFELEALRGCALFREASNITLQEFCEVLEPFFFLAGETLIKQGDTGDCMYVLHTGKAALEVDGARVREYHAGAIFGEVALLGMGLTRRATIRALQPCVAQALHRPDFHRVLEEHPNDRRCFEALRELAQESKGLKSVQQVRQQVLFRDSSHAFITRMSEVLECRVYFPGEVVFAEGDTGPFALYLLVTGECRVSVGGCEVTRVVAGETFGETATLGYTPVRTATVTGAESPSGEQSYCFVLHQGVLDNLLKDFPDERERLLQIAAEKNGLAATAHKRRAEFLQEVVAALPKSGAVPLFHGHSEEFIAAVAANGAEEISAGAGKVIVEACVDDAALFVVLDGEVDIEVGHARCARLAQHAAIGELAILGVFTKQVATIRAATNCKIFRLPAEALNTASNDERFQKDRMRLDALRERLNKQGAEGLKAVRCFQGCQELCRKVLALHAMPFGLEQGTSWVPKPAEHGEVFILALRGRSIIALPGVSGAPVMLKPGDSVPDALLRRFGASLHALDETCEFCLLPRHMLLAGVMHFPEARPWFDVLRSSQSTKMKSLENKLRMHLIETTARLDHPRDEGISSWARKRREAITRAEETPKPCFGVGPSQEVKIGRGAQEVHRLR